MTTVLADIHRDIVQTHILPRLDGPSLFATATATVSSSRLSSVCSDHSLWANISKSTWPSITDPRVNDIISAFPTGHRSFFHDSFPSLITDVNRRNHHRSDCYNSSPWPAELISAVDIHYQNDVIYSRAEFTNITPEFRSSELLIKLKEDPTCDRPGRIGLKVDELAGADEATLSHLKESVTLNWILIDTTRKRAGNLSSTKPVSAKRGWMSNETILQYVIVLPGCDPNEMVECKIRVVLGVAVVGLHVKEVMLELHDLDSSCLCGRDFLVIMQRAILEEIRVKRKVVDDAERLKIIKAFKTMKRERRELVKKEEEKIEFSIKMNYVGILVSFSLGVYFLMLLLN